MRRVVIDTNVIISAALNNTGNPSEILSLISERKIQMYCNAQILAEYATVLSRGKFKFSLEKQQRFLSRIQQVSILIDPILSNIPFLDESDRVFFDTAVISDSILVTGNLKHYPKESFILSPLQYITMYNQVRT